MAKQSQIEVCLTFRMCPAWVEIRLSISAMTFLSKQAMRYSDEIEHSFIQGKLLTHITFYPLKCGKNKNDYIDFLRSLHKVFVHSSSRCSHRGCCSKHPKVTEWEHSAQISNTINVISM